MTLSSQFSYISTFLPSWLVRNSELTRSVFFMWQQHFFYSIEIWIMRLQTLCGIGIWRCRAIRNHWPMMACTCCSLSWKDGCTPSHVHGGCALSLRRTSTRCWQHDWPCTLTCVLPNCVVALPHGALWSDVIRHLDSDNWRDICCRHGYNMEGKILPFLVQVLGQHGKLRNLIFSSTMIWIYEYFGWNTIVVSRFI